MTLAREWGDGGAELERDLEIRKVDDLFVRRWRMVVSDEDAARALADRVVEVASARDAAVERLSSASSEHLRLTLGVETFDLEIAPRRRSPTRIAARPTPAPTATATPRPKLAPDRRGRLAILLDDAGQNLALVPAAAALPPEVGVAVLPFLPSSVETAAALYRADHEVWLHLPMEPIGADARPGPGSIRVAMSREEIRTTVHSALNNVPHVVGVNNHMGSRATADLRTMTWVMQELSARGMAFIDSRTTKYTVAEDAARAQGVPAGRRHLFLDNRRTREAVRRQLEEAVYRARLDGELIAIGHLNRVTVEVLEDELPTLAGRKVDLVPPTSLVR